MNYNTARGCGECDTCYMFPVRFQCVESLMTNLTRKDNVPVSVQVAVQGRFSVKLGLTKLTGKLGPLWLQHQEYRVQILGHFDWLIVF